MPTAANTVIITLADPSTGHVLAAFEMPRIPNNAPTVAPVAPSTPRRLPPPSQQRYLWESLLLHMADVTTPATARELTVGPRTNKAVRLTSMRLGTLKTQGLRGHPGQRGHGLPDSRPSLRDQPGRQAVPPGEPRLDRVMELPQLPCRPTCDRCELHCTATNVGIPWQTHAPTAARNALVLLGDRPGIEDDRQGTPFVGPSGSILWGTPGSDYLSELNPPSTTTVYGGTILRCWAPAKKMPASAYKACSRYTLDDLNHLSVVHPGDLTLLCMGAAAASVIHKLATGTPATLRDTLNKQGLKWGRWSIYFTYNPGQLLPHAEPALVTPTIDHLRLVSDHMHGRLPESISPTIVPPGPIKDTHSATTDPTKASHTKA
jgi:uracil-DNA glycosylase family 4